MTVSTSRSIPPRESLGDEVTERLREMMRRGELVPGELYSVYRLAELLGVSRSPVREAVLKLAEGGLVASERNRGFRVLAPDARALAEIFAVRLILEPPAVAEATRRCTAADRRRVEEALRAMAAAAEAGDEGRFWQEDRAFHRVVLSAAGNRRIVHIVDELRDATLVLGAGTTTSARPLRRILDQHARIAEAMGRRAHAQARQRMHAHLTETGQLLLAQSMGAPSDAPEVLALWAEVVSA